MMATASLGRKDARLDIRMDTEQKDTITRAAAASGLSISQWALDRLMSSARSDLLEASTLHMTTQEFEAFARLLDEPQDSTFASFVTEDTPWGQ